MQLHVCTLIFRGRAAARRLEWLEDGGEWYKHVNKIINFKSVVVSGFTVSVCHKLFKCTQKINNDIVEFNSIRVKTPVHPGAR